MDKLIRDIDWEEVKKVGLLDGDFYLADLLSSNGTTIRENLYVVLKNDYINQVIDIYHL